MSDISKIKIGETVYDVKDKTIRDAFTNSKKSIIDSVSDDDHIPTAKAAYDYGQTIKNEILEKKVMSIDATSDNEHVPSAKAVYDFCANFGPGSGSGGSDVSSEEFNTLKQEVEKISESVLVLSFSNVALMDDYYSIYTAHSGPGYVAESTPVMGDLYKVSDYTNGEGLFRVTINGLSILTSFIDITPIYGLPIMISLSEVPFMIAKETFVDPDPAEGEEPATITPGLYASASMNASISHLARKDKFLVQEKYPFVESSEPLFGYYHRVGEAVSTDGLYSVLGMELVENLDAITVAYGSGGKFQPIVELEPTMPLEGVYGLVGGHFTKGIAAVNVVTPFVLPAGALNNDEDVSVESGLYLYKNDFPTFGMVKLQEKNPVISLDSWLNSEIYPNTILETLMAQLTSSQTGEATLTIQKSDLTSDAPLKELYKTLLVAFNENDLVKMRLTGVIGTTIDMLCPVNLWTVADGYSMCAGATGVTYTEGMWITTNLQLVVNANYFELYCKAKAAI